MTAAFVSSPRGTVAGPLRVRREGAVAWLMLDRPDHGNAIDLPLARALSDAAIACDCDPSIRCVVLGGNGRMFCAGGDIAAFAAAGGDAAVFLSELAETLHMAMSRFARMAKPFVTMVHGPAAGAGFTWLPPAISFSRGPPRISLPLMARSD